MAVRTPVGLSPEIPLVIKRELLELSRIAQTAQSDAQTAQKTANSKLGGDLNKLALELRSRLQPGGVAPLEITGLLGHAAQPQVAGVPNVTKLPLAGPYAQPGSLVSVNGVLFGYKIAPNTSQLPYVQPSLSGTHAQRLALYPAANYPPGMLFFETDRDVFYVVELIATVPTWAYAAGQMACMFGSVALPTDLGINDAGFLAWEDSLKHVYRWGGGGWVFADGGAGQICAFYNSVPNGGVWGFCDGSTYNVALANGTGTTPITSPNMTGDVFLKGGTPGPQQAATHATWDPSAKTDDESAHTH